MDRPSATTRAEPSGSLRAMLGTQIRLIEFLELKVLIDNIDRRDEDRKVSWQAGGKNYNAVIGELCKSGNYFLRSF